MATLLMPIRSDLPSYEFQLDLEGSLYTFRFRFNRRMERWIMDVLDENDLPLILGTPLHIDWDLLRRFQNEGLPPGNFYLVDESGEGKPATRETMGGDHKLFYIEAG